MVSQSLSVSFPQRSRAEPVNRFHLPSIWSQFMFSPTPSGFPAQLTCGTFAAVLNSRSLCGAKLPRSGRSGLFAQLNMHFQRQILHLGALSYPVSPHRGGSPALGPARAETRTRHFQKEEH